MKIFFDIMIVIVIALIAASFFLKGWSAVICAGLAAVFAAVSFILFKKSKKK